MNVCDGGTVSSGITVIPFTNTSTTTDYTITSCKDANGNTMPGWPTTDPVIPKASSANVVLKVATISGKQYTYIPSPVCPNNTPPKIVVQ